LIPAADVYVVPLPVEQTEDAVELEIVEVDVLDLVAELETTAVEDEVSCIVGKPP